MPILRKIIQVGASRAVSLPKSWLENAEQESGKKIIAIAMEVDGSIILKPIFQEKNMEGEELKCLSI